MPRDPPPPAPTMTLRRKVLLLLAALALLPQALVIALDAHLLRSLSRTLTARNAAALTTQAEETIARIARDYAITLDREARRVRLLLALQAAEAERLLATPPANPRPLYRDRDFDAGLPALGLVHEPVPGSARGARPLAVSWDHVSLHLTADATASADGAAARALAAMSAFYNLAREPDDSLLGWHYVVLENGLSASWPGHGGNPPGFDPRARPWYAAQRDRPVFRWYRPHRDASTGTLLINATLPLFAPDSRFLGLTGLDVDLGSTFALLELPPGLDAESEVLHCAVLRAPEADPPQVLVLARRQADHGDGDWQTLPELVPLDLGDAAATAQVRAAMLAGENGLVRTGTDDAERLVIFQRYGEGFGYVVIGVPVARAAQAAFAAAAHAETATRTHVRSLLLVMAALLAAVIVAAFAAARHVSRPLEALGDAVARLAGGDLRARAEVRTHDEFATLGTAFNAMVPRLAAHAETAKALALAHEVQQQLLPRSEPAVPGYDIAGMTRYSAETGGDFYDFLPYDDAHGARLAVIVADVAGHGIGPALLMATTRALLHGGREHQGAPGDWLTWVNRELADDLSRGHFVTLFLLALDSREHRLAWASAGHDPALVFRAATRTMEALGAPDIPLGIDGDWRYASCTGATLAPGDLVVIGTDGIWDSHNAAGERYGKERLARYIADHAEASAAALCRGLEAELVAFREGGAQTDDLTLVVVKRLPPAATGPTGSSA